MTTRVGGTAVTRLRPFLDDPINTTVAAGVFLFTLAVYTITLTPTVPFWDGGEFIATSYILGVPHAPGTPLFVLIGRLATLIPIATVAQRVNWFSALSSAVAVLFIYLITVKIVRRVFTWEERPEYRWLGYLAGTVAGFVCAFSTTFWDNAIEAEVYAASCALMAVVIWLVLRWDERLDEGNEDGLLLVITYLVGLGVGIHLGVAVASWAAVVYVFMRRPRYLYRWNYLGWGAVTLSLATGIHIFAFMVAPVILILTLLIWLFTGKFRSLAFWSALLFMVGISVHLYLIIRANLNPMINEAAPKTWDALWKMLIRDQYKPAPIYQRKADWGYQLNHMWLRYMWWNFSLFAEQVGDNYKFRDLIRGILQPAVLLTAAGAYINFRRDRATAILMGLLFLLFGPAMAVYLNFREGEVRERDYFFVQNFMYMAVWTGVGAAWFVDWMRRQFQRETFSKAARWVAAVLVLAIAIIPMGFNWRSHDRRGFQIARDYAYNILAGLEPNALIFTNGDNDTFPLWYLQEVEHVRRDVRILNLSLLNTDWYIEQLRDLPPKVPITWTDAQIEQLYPYRDRDGKIWMVKDIAAKHILDNNKWQRPVYIAVTVPDHLGLDDQLSMEGLVFRVNPDPVTEPVNLEKTEYNLNHLYRYNGLILHDPKDPDRWLPDTTVYKDDNATRLSQNYCAAFTRVALRLLEDGKAQQALAQIRRAEAISPDFPGTVVTTGIILEEMDSLGAAEKHYRSALLRYPEDWQIPYRLGETLIQEKELEASIPFLERAIQNAPPDQYYPYQALASVYYQLNQYDRAASVLQRWLILHPDDRNVRPLYDSLLDSFQSGRPDSGKPAPPAGTDEH
jgi:tetratricopeptide (TPR) repeat protein